eukprot:5129414-Prymnesium_polylepis.1
MAPLTSFATRRLRLALGASGVTRRAAAVHRGYELSAMRLDEQHHGTVRGMVGGRLTPLTGPGP